MSLSHTQERNRSRLSSTRAGLQGSDFSARGLCGNFGPRAINRSHFFESKRRVKQRYEPSGPSRDLQLLHYPEEHPDPVTPAHFGSTSAIWQTTFVAVATPGVSAPLRFVVPYALHSCSQEPTALGSARLDSPQKLLLVEKQGGRSRTSLGPGQGLIHSFRGHATPKVYISAWV